MNDALEMSGEVVLELFGPDGALKERRVVPNLVVTAGRTVIAERLAHSSPTKNAMSHIAVGTGTTPAALADTALQTELARQALLGAVPTPNTVVYSASFAAGAGTGTWTEAGIFNASPAGDMLCRSVFGAISKSASDNLTVTWTLTFN